MWQADGLVRTWEFNTQVAPLGYMDGETPTLQIQIAPAAWDGGLLDLLYAAVPTTLSNTGVLLSVPDECAPAVKWRTVALLLGKVGPMADPVRAAWAEQRYQEGVELVRLLLDGWEVGD